MRVAEDSDGTQSLAARIEAAVQINGPINPNRVVRYNGEAYELQDLPDPSVRAMAGYGHQPLDIKEREHLTRPDGQPWPYSSPETCLVSGGMRGVWIDENHLTCPGCGLDFT